MHKLIERKNEKKKDNSTTEIYKDTTPKKEKAEITPERNINMKAIKELEAYLEDGGFEDRQFSLL